MTTSDDILNSPITSIIPEDWHTHSIQDPDHSHQLTSAELPTHSNSISDPGHSHTMDAAGLIDPNGNYEPNNVFFYASSACGGGGAHTHTVSHTGVANGGGHWADPNTYMHWSSTEVGRIAAEVPISDAVKVMERIACMMKGDSIVITLTRNDNSITKYTLNMTQVTYENG